MGCERSDSFHASGCGKCFWPPCFGFLGTVPGLSQRHESERSRLALTHWWVSGERQQSRACVPESLPPARAVCPDPVNPSTLSSRRSAASFYAVSVPFSSESCCPCSDPLPSDARLVFQPCQTWFVFEALKKSETEILWLYLTGSAWAPAPASSIFWRRRGGLDRRSGHNWSRRIGLVSNPDVLTSAMSTPVIFLFSHCRDTLRWGGRETVAISLLYSGVIAAASAPDFHTFLKIVMKGKWAGAAEPRGETTQIYIMADRCGARL